MSIRQHSLGSTGQKITSIGLGTWAMGGDEWGPSDDRESIRVIRRAVERSMNLIDTADVYGAGHSEDLVREAIGDNAQVRIVSKVGWDIYSDPGAAGGAGQNFERSYLEHALMESLRRLGRRAIDIYLLHDPPRTIIDQGAALDVLRAFKARGLVGAAGISVGTEEEALAAIAAGAEVIELPFNAIRPWAAARVLSAARSANVGVIAREPLERGLLSGKYKRGATFAAGDHRGGKGDDWIERAEPRIRAVEQAAERVHATPAQVAIAFVLAHDGVSTVIPGARSTAQLEENIAAGELVLTQDILESLAS